MKPFPAILGPGFVLVLALVAAPAPAWDFGVDVNNITSALVGRGACLSQQDTVSPWVSLTTDTSRFRAEAFVQYQGTFQAGASAQVPYRLDVKELSYSLQWPNLVVAGTAPGLKVGRFEFDDATGRVLADTFDGLTFRQPLVPVDLSFQAGYTGLVAQRDVNINLSALDHRDYQADDAPYFAPRRIFVGTKAVWADVVDRHDVTVEALGQFDLRSEAPIHTGYLTASFAGRPASWFRWSLYATGELWSDSVSIPAAAAGARVQVSVPTQAGLVAVAGGEWASGRTGGTRSFVGVGEQPLGSVSPEVFSNVAVGRTSVALRAFPGTVVGVGNSALFRAGSGPPADEDFPKDATSIYLGDELVGTLDCSFAGEWKLNGKVGAFLPNRAADAYGSGEPVRWLGTVDATWSW
jgi:hypothetical protein